MRTVDSDAKKTDSYVYLRIKAGGTDISDRVTSCSISESTDSKNRSCDLTIRNHPVSDTDLSPLGSSNVLDIYNDLTVEVGITTAIGRENVSSWNLIFDGIIGDDVDVQRSWEQMDDEISVSARDQSKRLQDAFILAERKYGSDGGTTVTTVIQNIMDDELGGDAPTLNVEDDPNFAVYPYKVSEVSVWEAIQKAIKPTGYDLRYKYDAGSYKLTLSDPGNIRALGQPSSTGDSISIHKSRSVNVSDDRIRNWIKVIYQDRETNKEEFVVSKDTTSISNYKERKMKVQEGDSSLIDTNTEAVNFANYIRDDLKDPAPKDRLEVAACLYYLEPYDYIEVTGDNISGNVGIKSLSWEFEPPHFATTKIEGTRNKVVGEDANHLASEVRGKGAMDDGRANNELVTGSSSTVAPEAPLDFAVDKLDSGVRVRWKAPEREVVS